MLLKSKLAILAGVMLTTNTVSAMNYDPQENGHWGVDLQQTFAKPKNDWEKVFRSKQAGFNLYFGYDFNHWAGWDAGVWWTLRKTTEKSITNGTSALGVVNNADSTVSSRIRHRGIYLDLNLYSPSYQNFNVLAKIGANYYWQHPSINTAPAGSIGGIIDGVKGKSKLIPKLGLGAQWMYTDMWGLRLLWQHDMIASAKFKNISPPYDKAFKNANTFSIGVFRKFDFTNKLL